MAEACRLTEILHFLSSTSLAEVQFAADTIKRIAEDPLICRQLTFVTNNNRLVSKIVSEHAALLRSPAASLMTKIQHLYVHQTISN